MYKQPRYPVYIISKGRAETPLTVQTLRLMGVIDFHIVIEPQEYDEYCQNVDPKNILVLPFSNLGFGSIPARNWVMEHSIKRGADRHWIMDDNIRHFYRYHKNEKIRMMTPAPIRIVEDYTDRFTNVGMSGMNYDYFIAASEKYPPLYLNTRVYSCILLNNHILFRWRGRYNEDTDISLRILKYGMCTILFNAVLAGKITTMVMKGGNTEEIYGASGKIKTDKGKERHKFVDSIVQQHPDVARAIVRWGRGHHYVDYSCFKQKLKPKPEFKDVPDGIDEYGLKLTKIDVEPKVQLWHSEYSQWALKNASGYTDHVDDAYWFNEYEANHLMKLYPFLRISESIFSEEVRN